MSSQDGTRQGGGRDEPPGAPKRPTPTIELKAEEVPAAEPARVAAEAAGQAATETDGPDAPDGPTEADGAGAPEGPPPPPARATEPRELRAFFTHMAAGVLGGLVGVAVAAVGLDRLPRPGFLFGELPPAHVEPARVEALETRLSGLEPLAPEARRLADDAEATRARVARLERDVEGLAAPPDGAAVDTAALDERLTELANRMDADLAALRRQAATAQIRSDDVAALKTDVARLAAESEELGRRLETRVGGPDAPRQLADRLQALSDRVVGLESGLDRAARDAAALGARARVAAAALALARLNLAVLSGHPYRAELAAVANLAPETAHLAALETPAAHGVPTPAALRASFDAHVAKALGAEGASPSDDWTERLMARARSVVTLRRTDPDAGTGVEAAIARMETRLDDGDLAGAVAAADALPDRARAVLGPWLDAARARLAALAALESLERDLVSRLGADTDAGAGVGKPESR